MKVELSNCLWIPESLFDDGLRDEYTVGVYNLDGSETEVAGYRLDRPGYVGLPRVRGLKTFAMMPCEDLRTTRSVKFPKQVALRDEQAPVVERALELCDTHSDFILKAATGKGKTVMGLAMAARLGQATVVVVDQEFLMDQWVERAKQHLGLKDAQIGIVRGPKMDYKGKLLTICMAQTLARKESLPKEFCDYFGFAIFDESQTAGAPTFSRALLMFSAKNRIGLSATPDRGDSLQYLIRWSLGVVAVELSATPDASNVYILESDTVYSWRANAATVTGRYLTEIAEDARRNLRIADAVKWLYQSGRDVLVISDRIEQLQGLFHLCAANGVPESDMRMCAKSRMVWRYEKDPTPPRQPPFLQKGAPYSPVRLSWVQKTVPKKELDEAKQNGRVLFATYGIMAKGVDIPRLSAGIDATPRAESTQVVGRILRPMPGKLRPIWVTIADINSYRSLHQLCRRIQDYVKSNAEVFRWNPSKGRKRIDHRHLRADFQDRVYDLQQARIVTALDGRNMLQMTK
jgi:superfamily II DNA or RNA helicase